MGINSAIALEYYWSGGNRDCKDYGIVGMGDDWCGNIANRAQCFTKEFEIIAW